MFNLQQMVMPIIAAPMAGGVSTPDLVVNVSEVGGLGFLAAGYKSPDAIGRQIREVQQRSTRPFGVNLFVPEAIKCDRARIDMFRARLEPAAARYGVELPTVRSTDDDWFDEKLNLVVQLGVPIVSLTFGLPPASVIGRLHDAGIFVVATVTTVSEATAAAAVGVDALCVQGPEAGGHRATFHVADDPESLPIDSLLGKVEKFSDLPVIAAGGISTGRQVAELLHRGASAVQVGTILLRSTESGAKPAHKEALADPRFTQTVVTRAFSGRPARGLSNNFINEHGAHTPALYPQIHHLTSPIRAAAGDRRNPQDLALWAGTGYRFAVAEPVSGILRALWQEAREMALN